MNEDNKIESNIVKYLKSKYDGLFNNIILPPPVFVDMEGNILGYDNLKQSIRIKYPLKYKYANPFGKMQGGIIAAAIDNTFGPLSMLTASLNYTRKLEVKYKKQIEITDKYIIVEAIAKELRKNNLYMEAKVFNHDGCVMATAKATNWIV
ncbi:MAG: hypothetical protein KJN84_09255 [Bacteroidia bacterium]|nr:hypothetical protein [Bacteroidia bacterium]